MDISEVEIKQVMQDEGLSYENAKKVVINLHDPEVQKVLKRRGEKHGTSYRMKTTYRRGRAITIVVLV